MCWRCGSPIPDPEPLGRSLRCNQCGGDLRICRHCRNYSPGSRGDCREGQAEMVADKERANFCDWFSLDLKFREKTPGNDQGERDSARKAFDNLFR